MKALLEKDVNVESQQQQQEEIKALSRLRHPNCIQLKHVDHQTSSSAYMYVVTDLCSGGDLLQKIKQGGPMPEAIVQNPGRQRSTPEKHFLPLLTCVSTTYSTICIYVFFL